MASLGKSPKSPPFTQFGLSPARLLCLVLVDPTGRYLKCVKLPFPCSQHQDNNLPFLLPLSALGLIATRPLPFLSTLSPSLHGRLLHLHGEAENRGRGAARSGRIRLLQEEVPREKDRTRDDERHIDKTKKDQIRRWTTVSLRDHCLTAVAKIGVDTHQTR